MLSRDADPNPPNYPEAVLEEPLSPPPTLAPISAYRRRQHEHVVGSRSRSRSRTRYERRRTSSSIGRATPARLVRPPSAHTPEIDEVEAGIVSRANITEKPRTSRSPSVLSTRSLSAPPFHSKGSKPRPKPKRKRKHLRLLPIIPSLYLINTANTARDQLSCERTFLAYVRTCVALASTGVALVQLFSLAEAVSRARGISLTPASRRFQSFARPLGVVLVGLSFGVLGIALYRYFIVQRALPKKKYPVERLSTALFSFVLGAVLTVMFGALLAGNTDD